MTGREDPPSLEDLNDRLRKARAKQEDARRSGGGGSGEGQAEQRSGIGLGMRLAFDLISGVVVGVAIGLGLDYWLGTTPWLLIVFLFLGAGAGMLNVYRTATGQGYAVGYHEGGEPPEKPEDGEG